MPFLERIFMRPSVLPEVQAELLPLTAVFQAHPEVQEARLFGSCNSGEYGKDIDIAVIIDSDDPEWSAYMPVKRYVCDDRETLESIYEVIPGDTDTRNALDDELRRVCPRGEPHIATVKDLKRIENEGSPIQPYVLDMTMLAGRLTEAQARDVLIKSTKGFGRAMMKGRLIYKRI